MQAFCWSLIVLDRLKDGEVTDIFPTIACSSFRPSLIVLLSLVQTLSSWESPWPLFLALALLVS